MRSAKLCNRSRYNGISGSANKSDCKLSNFPSARALRGADCLSRSIKDSTHSFQKDISCRGQRDGTPGSREQFDTELVFELANFLTQMRLSYAQFACRTREMEFLRNAQEEL